MQVGDLLGERMLLMGEEGSRMVDCIEGHRVLGIEDGVGGFVMLFETRGSKIRGDMIPLD